MTAVRMRLTGTAELQKALREFGLQADKHIAAAVQGTAQNIRTHAVKSIQRGAKTGKVYEKTDPKRTHKASAPGEAPATDTGRLANSINADIDGKSATVYTDLEYAPWLEFGTQNMEPRPFLFPAMEKERPKWEQRLDRIVDQAAKGILK
jgi:HK97 gp10 family phage protein